jgi:hypothetical protein
VNASLLGNPAAKTTLVLQPGSITNYVVSLGSFSLVANLVLNASGNLPSGCCSAVVLVPNVFHAHAIVVNCTIMGQHLPVATGVYFVDPRSRYNLVQSSIVTGMHFGAIFVAGLPRESRNTIEASQFFDNHCDAVTFAGYGELSDSLLHHNGWDCKNGHPPIPGGGPYCLGNAIGGVIQRNTVYDHCGMVLDIDRCANFVVDSNVLRDPGFTWNGRFNYCRGSLGVNLIDTMNFTFSNNIVENQRSSNAVGLSHWGDANHVFENIGAPEFSDLPRGPSTVVAFSVTARAGSSLSVSNRVVNNSFRADCSTAGCAGVGYFTGRGTGWKRNNEAWNPNMFTLNDPFGSDIGSRRCGKNWYAGDSPICPAHPPPPCNADDFQHVVIPFRNDEGCYRYSSSRPSRAEHRL